MNSQRIGFWSILNQILISHSNALCDRRDFHVQRYPSNLGLIEIVISKFSTNPWKLSDQILGPITLILFADAVDYTKGLHRSGFPLIVFI